MSDNISRKDLGTFGQVHIKSCISCGEDHLMDAVMFPANPPIVLGNPYRYFAQCPNTLEGMFLEKVENVPLTITAGSA